MACFSPLKAYRTLQGGISFDAKGGGAPLLLSCGQCIGCRLERSRQWAVRCVHESKMHDFNCFCTLTYSDDFLPENQNLNYVDFQRFMKRLRKRFSGVPIRFYMCGEYGETTSRPHYHVLFFGLDFVDRVIARKCGSGFMVYSSDTLTKLWGKGDCYVGDLTFESAAYCARYVMKKVTGKAAESAYRMVNTDTGEIFQRVPEFTHMSLKPGIGANFYDKYVSDIFPHDRVVVRGAVSLPPRYYAKRYRRVDPDSWEDVMRKRGRFSVVGEGTQERLRARRVCVEARLGRLVRSTF